MTKHNALNVKLSNSQLNKLKLGVKIGTQVTLKLSSNAVGDSNDEANFPHNLMLTHTQVSSIRKALANNSSANIKFSKIWLSKMVQLRGFIDRFLGALEKNWFVFNSKFA